ncbi:hypothetical protein DCC39_06995 [Pueribacillus theae]|uniref:LiaF transmembrane domain-containing protein n=1 Tax=Pueribacillus theae TaxID=2171751 RepID=A0A2U1K4Q4_9BACI|nr:hypothetical protein [Pueribacillus theae]PWA12174.1 hypothetical protein DCC39_06995 [Pueribacillus theae]
MKWTFKSFIGLALLALGGVIFLNVLGFQGGWFIRTLLAIFIVGYAFKKIKQAESSTQKGFGIAVLLFGILMFFGAVHIIFGLLFGLVFIYFGLKMMGKNSKRATKEPLEVYGNTAAINEDAFDIEWNKKMNNKGE